MEMQEVHMDITNLYAYRIEELAVGIVKAESYEDAREKVKTAYLKHNDCFDSEIDFIELKKIVENDSWFSDNPDVIEIDDLIQKWRCRNYERIIVRWTADGYCVEFHYLVIAESLDNAKELWDEYIKTHEKIQYSWDKAVKAVKHHYGGYISWKDNGDTNRSKGCYEMESENIFTGSDHLRD